jgi:hypothetical protein
MDLALIGVDQLCKLSRADGKRYEIGPEIALNIARRRDPSCARR